ncbi:hypothetical protein DFH11DRAFT_959637 [Phellopilus nigrolimitatus]|nr:hypothetical protein DFH11DRAFT_959637 [Phellopilus nigrolimitatus]
MEALTPRRRLLRCGYLRRARERRCRRRTSRWRKSSHLLRIGRIDALRAHRAVRACSVSTAAVAARAEGGQGGEDRETYASTGEALGTASHVFPSFLFTLVKLINSLTCPGIKCDGLAGGASLRTQRRVAAKGWGNDMPVQAISKVALGTDTQSLHRSRTLRSRSSTAGTAVGTQTCSASM